MTELGPVVCEYDDDGLLLYRVRLKDQFEEVHVRDVCGQQVGAYAVRKNELTTQGDWSVDFWLSSSVASYAPTFPIAMQIADELSLMVGSMWLGADGVPRQPPKADELPEGFADWYYSMIFDREKGAYVVKRLIRFRDWAAMRDAFMAKPEDFVRQQGANT